MVHLFSNFQTMVWYVSENDPRKTGVSRYWALLVCTATTFASVTKSPEEELLMLLESLPQLSLTLTTF